jgi:putative spermidine/putrescine transport system permease protein
MTERRSWARTASVFLSIWLFPVVHLIVLSLADSWLPGTLLPVNWHFSRWTHVLDGTSALTLAALRSLFLSVLVASVSTVLGFAASRTVAESRKRGLWISFSYLSFAFSPVIFGSCFSVWALRLGMSGTFLGVFSVHTCISSALALLILYPAWTPEKLAFASVAQTLGASPLQIWWRVLLPLFRPLLGACWVNVFFLSWMQYGLTLVVGAGKVKTLPLAVYDFLFEADTGYAAVAALLLLLPICLTVFVRGVRVGILALSGPFRWIASNSRPTFWTLTQGRRTKS